MPWHEVIKLLHSLVSLSTVFSRTYKSIQMLTGCYQLWIPKGLKSLMLLISSFTLFITVQNLRKWLHKVGMPLLSRQAKWERAEKVGGKKGWDFSTFLADFLSWNFNSQSDFILISTTFSKWLPKMRCHVKFS